MFVITARSGSVLSEYSRENRRKLVLLGALLAVVVLVAIYALTQGNYGLAPSLVLDTLTGNAGGAARIVVWNIRLPRIIAALVAGWGLAVSGLAVQTLLKNPLGSPFTLGINQGAAFGAALAIVVFGVGGPESSAAGAASFPAMYLVTLFAFLGAMGATLMIMALSRLRKISPEAMILAGMALSFLFTSATILVQLLASETELASVVFWTFGDVGRSGWREIGIMTAITLPATLWLFLQRWSFNALGLGGDMARGLGVEVDRIRLQGMFIASLVAAVVTAFHGIIGFIGLLAPHMARRLVGGDQRILLPFSALAGALLLLLADTGGRILLGSGALPVGVLTSFMGAPLFLWLLIRGRRS